jgi:hypothetical protein
MGGKRCLAAGVVALLAAACSSSGHGAAPTPSATDAPTTSTTAATPKAGQAASLQPAIAATRAAGTAHFAFQNLSGITHSKPSFTAISQGVVDFASGSTSFGFSTDNAAARQTNVSVDEVRAAGGSVWVHLPAGYRVALKQPAAWQLTYSDGGFGGGYQNSWCSA